MGPDVVPVSSVPSLSATVAELAELRRRVKYMGIPIAADESVRKASDPLAVARAGAADLIVVKVQPLGGVRRALDIIAESGMPAVVSSALDTSVGIAMGVALAAGRPLVGVPTLDALAAQAWGVGKQLCCVLDARKGQVYAASYRCDLRGNRHRTGDFLVLSPEALAARITEPTLVLGPGAAICAPWLADCAEARVAVCAALHPRAALVGFCAAEVLAAGATDGSADLAPLYVRASEAELGLGAKRSQGEQP